MRQFGNLEIPMGCGSPTARDARGLQCRQLQCRQLRCRQLRCLVFALALGWVAYAPAQRATAQELVDHQLENSVKVAYLYGFGRYVQWPESTFAATNNCFVIGVVGRDPTGGMLGALAGKKKINNRPIVIKRVDTTDSSTACHILYVPSDIPQPQQLEALELAARRPILTVGEVGGFLAQGGVVSFFRQGGTLRFSINADAAKTQGVAIDAKLLSLAKTDPR